MVSIVIEQLQQADQEEDRRSVRSTSTVASTVGTGTTSLASRIAALTVDFSDKLQEPTNYEDSILEGNESSYEESDDSDGDRDARTRENGGACVDEQDGLQTLQSTAPRPLGLRQLGDGELNDNRPPPFQVCSRLFIYRGNHPIQVKKISISQVDELKQHGYVVVDNFISRDLAHQTKMAVMAQYNKGRMAPGSTTTCSQEAPSTDRRGAGEHVMWLVVGKPPADTSPLANVMVAFQELHDDLQEFVKLKKATGEFQVSLSIPPSVGTPRHRDALPDNGREEGHCRVTAIVCCNTDWDKEHGGMLRIWPPRRGHPLAMAASRRSLAGSDADHSEMSDTCSFRSQYVQGSTTSSMIAELGLPEADGNSIDNVSLAESAETTERPGVEWLEVDGEMVLDVAPVAGRLVVFLSGATDHAQLPSSSHLVGATAWFQ